MNTFGTGDNSDSKSSRITWIVGATLLIGLFALPSTGLLGQAVGDTEAGCGAMIGLAELRSDHTYLVAAIKETDAARLKWNKSQQEQIQAVFTAFMKENEQAITQQINNVANGNAIAPPTVGTDATQFMPNQAVAALNQGNNAAPAASPESTTWGDNDQDYRGTVAVTEKGYACVNWNSNNGQSYVNQYPDAGLGDHNP